jgi:protein-serine/threonine kinase
MIGKGTFGKVYLIKNTKTSKFYAMKSIRKDVVVDLNSISNIHVEKLILL